MKKSVWKQIYKSYHGSHFNTISALGVTSCVAHI